MSFRPARFPKARRWFQRGRRAAPRTALRLAVLIGFALLTSNDAAQAADATTQNAPEADRRGALPRLDDLAIPASTWPLERSNAIRVLLRAFSSNQTARALVVLPGLVDEFHLIQRDAPPLRLQPRSVAEALEQLGNATGLRVTQSGALLLLHTTNDAAAMARLLPAPPQSPASPTPAGSGAVRTAREHRGGPGTESARTLARAAEPVLWFDQPWPSVHAELKRRLGRRLFPAATDAEAGHFERINLAAFGLAPAELATAVSLATGTSLVLTERDASFLRTATQPADR